MANFSFTLLPSPYSADHYKCHLWPDLMNKMATNDYFHLPNLWRFMEQRHCFNYPLRSFDSVPCPFDPKMVDFKNINNFGHLWIWFGYLTNPNGRREERRVGCKDLEIAESLHEYAQYVTQQNKLNWSREIFKEVPILPQHSPILGLVSEYLEDIYERITTACFELLRYIRSSWCFLPEGQCDDGLFSVTSCGFSPSILLFYLTQESGFQTSPLSLQESFTYMLGDIHRNTHAFQEFRRIHWQISVPTPYYRFMNGTKINMQPAIMQKNKHLVETEYLK